MARFCPVTGDPVLYPDCQECEWKRQCRQGFPGGLPAEHDTKNNSTAKLPVPCEMPRC